MEEGLMDTGVKDQVFTISQSVINKVKIKRKYSKSSNKPFGKNFDKFSDKQGKPKFKGRMKNKNILFFFKLGVHWSVNKAA